MKNVGAINLILAMSFLDSGLAQQVVTFPDENLRIAIEERLGTSPTTEDMLGLREFDGSLSGIEMLDGLESAENLETLYLASNSIADLGPLSGMNHLRYLFLSDNHIRDVEPLAGLTNLTVLDLSHNDIENIAALSNLSNLAQIGLEYNQIRNIEPLAELKQLTLILLSENPLSLAAYEIWIPKIENDSIDLVFEYDLSPNVKPVGTEMHFDDAEEFQKRVRIDDPPGLVLVEYVEEEALMRMRAVEIYSARAKIRMGTTEEARLRARIRYKWRKVTDGSRLDVYISDREAFGDFDGPNYVKAGTILPPAADYPGSIRSTESAIHEFPLDVNSLDLEEELWIETVLVQRESSPSQVLSLSQERGDSQFGTEVEIKVASIDRVCKGICLDFNGDGGTNEDDYLLAYGLAGDSSNRNAAVCIDKGFSEDWYVDIMDQASVNWKRGNCPEGDDCPKNLCLDIPLIRDRDPAVAVLAASVYAAHDMSTPVSMLVPTTPLLILGNHASTVATRFENIFSVSIDQYLFGVELQFDVNDLFFDVIEGPRLDPFGTRLVREPDGSLYVLDSNKGIIQIDGEPLISPGSGVFDGDTVHVGLQRSGTNYWGRPILDAVVDGSNVYVVPVVVSPADSDVYLAAAQLRPLGGGDFDIVRLFFDPDVLSDNPQTPNLTGLREIERDAEGNLYVLNVHGQNNSSRLWKFDPNGTILDQRPLNRVGDLDRIPHPSHICYTHGRLYVASGAHEKDSSGQVSVKVYVLDASDLNRVGTVTIEGMFQITSLTAGTDEFVYVAGYTILEGKDGHPTGLRDQSIPSARLVWFRGTPRNVIQAQTPRGEYGLAVPMSIIWTGYPAERTQPLNRGRIRI